MYSYKNKRNVHFKCNPIPSRNIGKNNWIIEQYPNYHFLAFYYLNLWYKFFLKKKVLWLNQCVYSDIQTFWKELCTTMKCLSSIVNLKTMISALEIFNLAHIRSSLFTEEFLAQCSTSAIFGTQTPILRFMQFLMYLENL